jgi:hypothetical protein
VSYEGFLSNDIALRLGFSIIPSVFISLPITVSGFIGREEYRFELGAGYNAASTLGNRGFSDPRGVPRIGYRFQPLQGGFNFGITLIPLVQIETDYRFFIRVQPWGGISLGWGY